MAPKARNIQDKAFENRVPCSRKAAKAGSATIAMTRDPIVRQTHSNGSASATSDAPTSTRACQNWLAA